LKGWRAERFKFQVLTTFEYLRAENNYRIVTTFHNVYAANFVAEAA